MPLPDRLGRGVDRGRALQGRHERCIVGSAAAGRPPCGCVRQPESVRGPWRTVGERPAVAGGAGRSAPLPRARTVPPRARSDSVRFSSPADAIVMWNIASRTGAVVSIQAFWRLRRPRAQARSWPRAGRNERSSCGATITSK